MPQNILVIGELDDGAPSATTLELLGGAQSLADGGSVAVTLLGSGASAAAAQASGAARAFVSDDATYDTFRGDQWLPAVQAAVEQVAPDLILMGQTTAGRELGPRLAFRLDTAVAMDCVNVVVSAGAIEATRPCYGGNAQATYTFATSPAIATVRAKSFDPAEGAGAADTTELPAAGESRVTVTGKEVTESEGLPLTDAPIVVSGGRGLGAPEAFEDLKQLADAIGRDLAAVGASRAAVDLGWFPPSEQVGLTGKVVTPDLYLAIAISGASQHMAGCSGAKTIVAINRDKDANIFGFSKYGIVGDWKQVVPALIEELKKG
ncbi:MAG: electron transfer flavoprotein subunit alpha/FixB family protein [Chloroflexi bacterium]|nr:electron transfer flavoprotein subunit alpha/FixB family protein [Chloroflexota bacterium]MQC47519.1 electron transfer flavoprotein subunit alpha/FixB family protein [Chloroflexota bacterium]